MIDTYCTLEDVKNDLDLVGTQDDSLLEEYILDSKAYIDSQLGYSFGQTGTPTNPVIHTYTGTSNNKLFVDSLLQLVQCQIVYPANFQGVAPPPIDITWDVHPAFDGSANHAIILYRNYGVFEYGLKNIQVSGVWGRCWDTDPVPQDIARAARRLAVHFWKIRDTGYADVQGTRQTGRVTYHKDIPKDVQMVLNRNRPRTFLSRTDLEPKPVYTIGWP
jgi:hypothetical protein